MATTRSRAAAARAARQADLPPSGPRAPRRKRPRRFMQPSTHIMRTRRRANTLDFMSFAPEIRNLIYSHMYHQEETTKLTALRLPSSLRVPGIFTEALPILFENTPVAIPLRSNWCVRKLHLHGPGNINFDISGKFELPAMLGRMPESVVRFRQVKFEISCCCCTEMKTIAEFDMDATGREVTSERIITCKSTFDYDKSVVIEGLEKMLDGAEKLVDTEMKTRDGFNGFGVADLERIAMCFCETPGVESSEAH